MTVYFNVCTFQNNRIICECVGGLVFTLSMSSLISHFQTVFALEMQCGLYVHIANVKKQKTKLSTFAMLDPLVSTNVYFSLFCFFFFEIASLPDWVKFQSTSSMLL